MYLANRSDPCSLRIARVASGVPLLPKLAGEPLLLLPYCKPNSEMSLPGYGIEFGLFGINSEFLFANQIRKSFG